MSDAREQMVHTAALLFQRHGYNGVGFRRIVEESGSPRGSIYHHFPGGKEQLGAEAITWSGAALTQTVAKAAEEADVAGVLEQLGDRLAGWLENSNFSQGCPVATVALECAPQSVPVADACRDVFRDWITVLRDRLIVEEGWEQEEARAFATTVVAALEGALILARVERDAEPVRTVARDLASRAR